MSSPQFEGRAELRRPGDEFFEKLRVLLVDDDEDSYVIAKRQLDGVDGASIDLGWAGSFEAGLQAMLRSEHDAYLVDFSLGARDGLELMRQARAEGCLAPIIILTGQGDHEIDLRATKEGAADFLVKDEISGQFIERSLRYAIERHRAVNLRLRHEAQMRIVTEQMPAVLWTTDLQLRFTSSSGAGMLGLDLKSDQFVGQTLFQILNTNDKENEAIAAHLDAMLGKPAAFEIDWMERRYHGHVNPLRQNGGPIVGTIGVALDVTNERHVQLEMRAARRIQESFLPKSVPIVPGFDLAGVCHPARAAGGDYYDYIKMPDGSLGIVIADVSHHGFGSAMIMADVCRLVRMLSKQHMDLSTILTAANRALAEDMDSDFFVTLFMARLDPAARSLSYAAAGHDGYLLDSNGRFRNLGSTSLPLGVVENTVVPYGETIALEPGQSMILFTDGFSDVIAPNGKMFGSQQVLEFVRNHRARSAREILDGLYAALQDYCRPNSHHDDGTAVILKVEA